MNVAAYIRKSLTGLSVREQFSVLEGVALDKGWNIVWCVVDPGEQKAGDYKSNPYFLDLLATVLRTADDPCLQGVMFWHSGHAGGSLLAFIDILELLSSHGLTWYVEEPTMESSEERWRLLISMSEDLRDIHTKITRLNLMNRSASMKVRGTSPGRRKVSRFKERAIVTMKNLRRTNKEIAETLGVNHAVVTRVIKEHNL